MKITRDNIILVVGIVTVASLIFAWAQGHLGITLLYFVILMSVIVVIFVILYKKETNEPSIKKAKEAAIDALRGLGLDSEGSEPRIIWMSKHTDNKRFSSYGKVWDIQFDTLPSKTVVQLDAKTLKVVNVARDTKSRDPPFFAPFDADTSRYDAERGAYRRKREIKEEITR